jgi:spermidine synthase
MLSEATTARAGRALPVIVLVFFASGCSALIYEVVWFHLLRLAIGSSGISIAILLASFMGGLCIGSLLLPRMVPPSRHPFRVYATLELLIGAFGALLLVLLPAISRVYLSLTGHGFDSVLLRAALAGVCLLPPTILMGATLPAIARWLDASPSGIARVGLVYSANTIGAVFGTVLAGFYLLRFFDVVVATAFAVSINVAIALVGFGLAARMPYAARSDRGAPPERFGRELVLPLVIGLSGFAALGAQVVWTRLLSLLFGATIYSFTIILAIFLTGLGVGSGVGSYLARRTDQSAFALAVCQVMLVLAIPFAAYLINAVIPYSNLPGVGLSGTDDWMLQTLNDIYRAAPAILPATMAWGASVPLALAAARRVPDPGILVARIYAANTVGAILGSICVSLLFVPAAGSHSVQQLLIVLSAVAAAIMLAKWERDARPAHPARPASSPGERPRHLARIAVALALAVLTAVATVSMPRHSPALIAYGWNVGRWERPARYLHTAEGMTASVAITDTPTSRAFSVGGKIEATTLPQDMRLQRMLAHFPALLHGAPKSVLVVGFGAGVTAGSLLAHAEVERIVIVEIEPEVPAATSVYFREQNSDVFNDPRVEIIYDDARHYVATAQETFDVITSDPIHPWVRGSAALYTREFFSLARARLKPGGVYTQWIPLYETSDAAVKSQVATFYSVFPDGSVWSNDINGLGYDVVMIGGKPLWKIDFGRIRQQIDEQELLRESLESAGIGSVMAILQAYAGQEADSAGWLGNAQLNLDRNMRLEYLAGSSMRSRAHGDILRNMTAGMRYPVWRAGLTRAEENGLRRWYARRRR